MKLTTAGLILWAAGTAGLYAGWMQAEAQATQEGIAAAVKLELAESDLAKSNERYEFLSELQQAISEIADACRRNNSDLAWIHVTFHAKSPPEGKFGCGRPRKSA